jgi:hypothetical protein
MPSRTLVALPCKLLAGMFSGERVFKVKLADGKEYVGIAPRDFCWNKRGELVKEGEPAGEEDGMVAAKVVDDLDGHQVAVEVPTGEVIAVEKDQVLPRPTEIKPPTPRDLSAATEPETNVPV